MVDSYLRNEKGERVYPRGFDRPSSPYGDDSKSPHPGFIPQKKPDKTPEQIQKEREDLASGTKDLKGKVDEYGENFKKWSEKKAEYARKNGGSLVPVGKLEKIPYGKKPIPWQIAGEVAWWILNPPLDPNDTAPDWEIPIPDVPTLPVKGDQTSICGMGPIRIGGKYVEGMPRFINQYRIRLKLFLQRKHASFGDLGIVKVFDTVPYGTPCNRHSGIAGQRSIAGGRYRKYWTQVRGNIPYSSQKYISSVNVRRPRSDWDGYSYANQIGTAAPPEDDAGLDNYFPVAELECSVEIIYDEDLISPDPVNPNDYDRTQDEEEMGCKWQKDEISYELPRLKIGDTEIGGSSINIDDGLLPLAQYLCSAMKMMHSGIGLDLLDKTELPVNLTNKGGAKVKHKSLAELSQWQFDNVSSLVGLPVKNTITNLDNETKNLQFKNIQDCLSYIVHQQKESDLDLMVVEQYCTKIAQQLEAVTQIALRQQTDIEMIIHELGFKYKWETEKRYCLYKTGMKDDDERTGILELFKGGEVSYPVRKWDDELDQRQIALRTNLYAEIAAKAYLQPKNSKDEISGLDARIKMGKADKENWLEWVKTINAPEKGVTSGSTTPFIEEYDKGTIVAKAVKTPASGLSLFMKPVKPKTK